MPPNREGCAAAGAAAAPAAARAAGAGQREDLQPGALRDAAARDGVEAEGQGLGLDAGQRIVVQGAGFLNDGDIVRIVPEASASTLNGTPDRRDGQQ